MPGLSLRRLALSATVALALAPAAAPAQTVRMASDGDLKILDPIWTTQFLTVGHGYMIYDVPYAYDEGGIARPQMIGEDTVSPDGLTWTFRLRPGLKFQDGTPVTAKDVAASIQRWGARATAGRLIMSMTAGFDITGDQSFTIRFKEKIGPLRELLSNPINPLFVMREADAKTDPNTQVTTTVGSGPFLFAKEEWVPGSKVVYKRNPDYVPRVDPPSGMAGAKIAKLDRVEWVYLPDAAVAVQALVRGEIDIVENPPADLVPVMQKAGNIDIRVLSKTGNQLLMRPNHAIPPFDNVKVRQALLYAVDQEAYLAAAIGNKDYGQVCWSVFMCGTPLESNAGVKDWGDTRTDRKAKARALLAEGGYKGEPIVLFKVTDSPILAALAEVTAQLLTEVGFKIDLQGVDTSTFGTRRVVKDPPSQNRAGWHLANSWAAGPVSGDPLSNNYIPTPCTGTGFFGWPCDDKLEAMRRRFVAAATVEERKALVAEYQAAMYEVVPYIPLGQFRTPSAFRSTISGVLPGPRLVMWNIEKR
ncbi:MAG: ABC transporter substrate-binding protein [Alphaproteobacteria bacterium]|nr:ABC transporter substrate-binding protein [Alphaproteobacteria bacterium]